MVGAVETPATARSNDWTSFDPKGQPVVSKAFLVQDAPAWASPLIPAAYATARIDVPGPKGPYLGTGFLVAPRRLVLADFVASILQEDEIELLGPATAEFDGASAAIEAILGTTDPERHAALARLAPFDAAPAKLRFALPEVGTRIAVIGYPRINFTPTPVTLAAFATYPAGSKMIMPGVIIDVAPTQLTYECWTMAGVAGGPIVDLVTGEVIGLHHSGRFEGGTRKTGWGVPLTAITELLEMT